jgi:hypothetical protein
MLLGFGLIGLGLFEPQRYKMDWWFYYFGNLILAVLGSILGGIIASRARANPIRRGFAWGVGTGAFAAGATFAVMTAIWAANHPYDPTPFVPELILGFYVFGGFTFSGVFLGILSHPGFKTGWLWVALPLMLLWGPALGLGINVLYHLRIWLDSTSRNRCSWIKCWTSDDAFVYGRSAMDAYHADVEAMMKRLARWLSEKDRRRYAAVEAAKLGHGGVEYVAQLLGCDPKTIRQGLHDLKQPEDPAASRVRKKGVDARR